MKKLFWIMIAALSVCVFAACSNDDEPQPVPEVDHGWFWPINRGDSMFMADLCNMVPDSTDWGYSSVRWRADDPYSWVNTEWGWDAEKGEYRLRSLDDVCPKKEFRCSIPRSIANCEYLYRAKFTQGVQHIPEEICKLPMLQILIIMCSHVTTLPDDIFNEDMVFVVIESNFDLACELPKSIVKLTDKPEVQSYFSLWGNAFKGAIPPITKAKINMHHNNLTSYTLVDENLKEGPGKFFAEGNRLTGELPPEILADTIAISYLYPQLWEQQKGYGITNLPTLDELHKMKDEWNKNHPDQKL